MFAFLPAIPGAKKGVQIFHMKSQANNLTLREILISSVILHSNWTMHRRSGANLGHFQQSSVGVDDRTVTLSQIVHLTLRRMSYPDANFDKQRRH